MQLRSSGFIDGAAIPRRFTCGGEDCPPPLEWRGAPTDTRSFVVLCNDPDAPAGTWHHGAAYDIPAGRTKLGESAAGAGSSFKQAVNDFQKSEYGGPCPPQRHGIHHFCLLALPVAKLRLRATKPSCIEVEREARKHVIAEGTLVGLYPR